MSKISKPCALCGEPMALTGKLFHPDCYRAFYELKRKMKRRADKDHDEISGSFAEVKGQVEWLLDLPNRQLVAAVGEAGENALLAFHVYLRRTD